MLPDDEGPFQIGTVDDGELQAYMQMIGPPPPGIRRTDFDTEGVARARQAATDLPATYDPSDPHGDDPDRWDHRREVVERLYERGAPTGQATDGSLEFGGKIAKERRAIVVLGPPASGKSSAIAEPAAMRLQAHLVDSDAAKELLDGYRDGLGAAAVHEEAAMITRSLLQPFIAIRQENMVLPLVGRSLPSVLDQIVRLETYGYTVDVYLVELPLEKAAFRAVRRFHATGRLVDPEYILSIDQAPKQTYDKVTVEERKATKYGCISTAVPTGVPPEVIESSAGAQTYEAFCGSL